MREILLNPGPVILTEGVRAALASPELCHREAEYGDLQERVRRLLLAVYGLDPEVWSAVLIAGSGTAAVEAMVATLVPRGGRLAVVENGIYGERIAAMARAQGTELRSLHLEWGAAIEPAALARFLEESEATHLAAVHHETTTGRLNDLGAIGGVCRERGVALLADGVSSFGGEELDLDGWGIAALASTAGKCLHGAPGVSFVIVRRERLAAAADPPRSVYLDLARHAREQERRGTAFTPAVPVLFALERALAELEQEGGWRARRGRYRGLGRRVREGFAELGVEPLLGERSGAASLTAWRVPAGWTYAALHDALKARGFVIYSGQGRLAGPVFRIATMGAIEPEDMERLVTEMGAILRAPPGVALAAAPRSGARGSAQAVPPASGRGNAPVPPEHGGFADPTPRRE